MCLPICVAVITDMHAAEVRIITAVSFTDTGKSIIHFAEPLKHSHYSGLETHGARSIEMRSQVGLLTRNIVIKGEGTRRRAYLSFLELADSQCLCHSPLWQRHLRGGREFADVRRLRRPCV
jgi:hypothetical protein